MLSQSGNGAGLADRLIARLWPTPAATIGERTRRRVSLHLLPFLFFLYILAYLDRVNVSVAQLDMIKPVEEGGLGFTLDIVGFGAGMFFWGYWILEIPSTLSVSRWGARWVFVRILVLWGLCAALVGGIGTPLVGYLFGWLPQIPEPSSGSGLLWRSVHFFNKLPEEPAYQFYFLRFMLGFFEGGFFPSVIVYLSYWFRQEDRAKAIAGFMSAIPFSSALGVPISGQLLKIHWFGLPGWRWIFILQGVAPMLAGIATLFLLPDLPKKARWLPDAERDWLLEELEREHKTKGATGHSAWLNHLGGVAMLTIVYFCLNLTSYGLSMFMPAIIKSQSGLSSENASLLAAIPYGLAFLAMYVNGWHSDRTNERPWHVAVPLTCMSLSIFLAASLDGMGWWPVLVMIFLVGPSMYAHLPAFWPIPTMFLGAAAAASAIGFINMIGNLGGGVGPTLVGNAAKDQVGFAAALTTIAPWPLLAAAVILVMGYTRGRASPSA